MEKKSLSFYFCWATLYQPLDKGKKKNQQKSKI